MPNFATSDLYDQYGDELQVLTTLLRSYGGRDSFAGEVVTIKCYEDNSRVKERLVSDGRCKVLVVDGGGSTRNALLGDSIAADAVRHGWEGVIIHGAVRDAAVLRTLDLGVFALASTPRKSVRRGEGQVELPISFGEVRFATGDFVYADADGVVVSKRALTAWSVDDGAI